MIDVWVDSIFPMHGISLSLTLCPPSIATCVRSQDRQTKDLMQGGRDREGGREREREEMRHSSTRETEKTKDETCKITMDLSFPAFLHKCLEYFLTRSLSLSLLHDDLQLHSLLQRIEEDP